MGHNGCLMFCQINADEERRAREPAHCRGATSKSGFSTIQASSYAQHPSNVLNPPGKTVFLPSDHVLQIHNEQCLSNQKTQPKSALIFDRLIRAFFWSRIPFPHPLRRLHLGFNIIPLNPRLVSCYHFLKKVFITSCIGKQFLADFNTVLFLIVSQQTRHEFCTEATHLKFFGQNLMARFYADAHFVSNFSDS